jgi:hypothetical protein
MNAKRGWKEGKGRVLVVALALLLALLTTMPGMAQTGPNTMSFQGRLLDGSGDPRGGEKHCMRLRMCTDDSNCGSTQVWPGSGFEEHVVITESSTYKAGLFNVSLGTASPIPPALLFDHDTLYVEIGVADDSTCPGSTWERMTPLSQIQTSAYAQRSRRVHTQESDDDYLVEVENTGQGGGVYAETDSTSDNARGGHFVAAGTSGSTYGVYAENDSTSDFARAGYFHAAGESGETYGVHAENESTTIGAKAGYFLASATTGQTYGVYAENDSTTNDAVAGYFHADGESGQTDAVFAKNDSTSSWSHAGFFYAASQSGATCGVLARNNSTSDDARAGHFVAEGTSGQTFGVYAQNDSDSGDAYAVYASKESCLGSDTTCHSVYTPDRMQAYAFDASGSDVAEYYPTDQALEPGDVVMADPRGGGRLVLSEGAYNTAVLGVVSTDPGMALGSGEDEGQALLALIGRVPVKASAENGAIRPGDLLVTASTPGHAMRCEGVEQCFGRTIGKALEGLESGSGVIQMLVTLQ